MTGSDFLQLAAADVPATGKAEWLVARVRDAVGDGRLRRGDRLPPSRRLAGELGVSRGVVVEAYARLADEGVVTARGAAGTRVSGALAPAPGRARGPGPEPGRAGSATTGARHPGPAALPLPSGALPEGVDVDLSPGVPDLSAFPRAAWLRAERRVLDTVRPHELGYGDPLGHPWLRRELAAWLARTRGTRAGPDDVLVVAGVAQSLALLAHVLRADGHGEVAVEDPGSRGARDELAHWGLRPVPVPVDDEGLDVAALHASGTPAVLVTPAHQFPTGVVLSPGRRRALLAWARAGNLVVEDDYDAEHRYDRAPVPALQAAAPEHVAHTGSTSKALAPGMRLGWLLPPPVLLDRLTAARRASDLGSPALPQLVLADLLATGRYDAHLRSVRARQRVRRDAVVAALARHVPRARVVGVAAGLHVLAELPGLPEGADVVVAERAAAAGVLVHPLAWHRVRPGPPGLVVGYAAHPPGVLHEAVARLATLVP